MNSAVVSSAQKREHAWDALRDGRTRMSSSSRGVHDFSANHEQLFPHAFPAETRA